MVPDIELLPNCKLSKFVNITEFKKVGIVPLIEFEAKIKVESLLKELKTEGIEFILKLLIEISR